MKTNICPNYDKILQDKTSCVMTNISPEGEKPVAFDWQDGEIYAGDEVYPIGDDLVLKDDLKEYIESVYGKAVTV